MPMSSERWSAISESPYPWEREALEFVRVGLPDHEPYRAWANFEFIADDGSINEVDLLVVSPKGFFLVEIKSWPGEIRGDAGTWVWTAPGGRASTRDNPLVLANRKAKKLVGLLKRQKAASKYGVPFLEPCVFLSADSVQCTLSEHLMDRVFVRDAIAGGTRRGILAAITRWTPGADDDPGSRRIDKPTSKGLARALQDAGIRPSQKARRVGDYRLDELLAEGPDYQDWRAEHAAIEGFQARVRLYPVELGSKDFDRELRQRGAEREFRILQGIHHEGILRPIAFTKHERGPALIFEREAREQRFDHFLKERAAALTIDQRLDLLRQLAETLRFAHDKKLHHRALSPHSVLVVDPDAKKLRLRVFNWQTGARGSGTVSTVSGTIHPRQLVEEASTIYMAPEMVSGSSADGESADVFSLGAIAYHLFAGVAPALTVAERDDHLRQQRGLDLAAVVDGAGAELRELVKGSTCPDVGARYDTVTMFLEQLDKVENELTAPDPEDVVTDPREAKPGEVFPGGLPIVRRLGSGSCSIAFVVRRNDQEVVLKVASSPEHDERIRAEAEVLGKLRHQNIVEVFGDVQIGDRAAILVELADETLAHRLRRLGRVQPELLQRFGEDLLDAVDWLEQKGIAHRDIKPDNIGVKSIGKKRLHLMLFDFSLARTPAESIRAGTRPYLDPFLPLRKPPRWDLHAERFAAAMTLYEMATGSLPVWGDGQSDPAMLEVEATIDRDLFEADLREPMAAFFGRALRRDIAARFDTCEDMRRAWRGIFGGADRPVAPAETESAGASLDAALQAVSAQTPLTSLPVSTRVLTAMERLRVATAAELLRVPLPRIDRMQGVGTKTRGEIRDLISALQKRLPDIEVGAATDLDEEEQGDYTLADTASVDLLYRRLLPAPRGNNEREIEALRRLTSLDPLTGAEIPTWPSQTEVAGSMQVTRARVGQVLAAARERWARNKAFTALRDEIGQILAAHGGVMTSDELARAVLARRGSSRVEPGRTAIAVAVTRAAIETERRREQARFCTRRAGGRVFVARRLELADYAERLGQRADELALADPLPGPARVREALEQVTRPDGAALEPVRLVRLAAAASAHAAVSSRLELYPRGMPADRALKLATGAVLGAAQLSVRDLRERVLGRYPEAAEIPDRPRLDALVRDAGWGLQWSDERRAYEAKPLGGELTDSRSSSLSRRTTGGEQPEMTPEVADARQFEEKLRRAAEQGAFLALTVRPKDLALADDELTRHFPVERQSIECLLIEAMHAAADAAGVKWPAVVRADAEGENGANWKRFMGLVGSALDRVRDQLSTSDKTLLLTHPGLLARYGAIDLVEHLRDRVYDRAGLAGAWLLIPSDDQRTLPTIDGVSVPVITAGQWARIPDAWLQNRHGRSPLPDGRGLG